MAEKTPKSFEGFEPLFGEAKAELDPATTATFTDSGVALVEPQHPLLFYIHSPDPSRLEIIATGFHTLAWQRSLTVHDFDDLRDEMGIAGSWSEFVNYFIASVSSDDVKILLEGSQHAKLVAHKSKGLPRISLSLNRLWNSPAGDAMANLSVALFKAFKDKQNDIAKAQERLLQSAGLLSSERERNESLQKQLDAYSIGKKRKVAMSKDFDKAPAYDTISNVDTKMVTEMQLPSEVLSANPPSMKASRRPAPINRRAKVRGASLQDGGDDHDA